MLLCILSLTLTFRYLEVRKGYICIAVADLVPEVSHKSALLSFNNGIISIEAEGDRNR